MPRENRLFLGNPGTGKSTLINCLIGEPKFKSGLSWGGGLTQDFHCVEHDGVMYMDTPGLADSSIAKKAAMAITEALKQGGTYKIFFMMRLQSGRVVSEDVVTLERVLSALNMDATKICFSVVFNSVDKPQYKVLGKPGSREFEMVMHLVNGRGFQTNAFCIIPAISMLSEASDAVATLPDYVYEFMDQWAPSMRIDPRVVKPIDPRGFAEQAQEADEEMKRLLREKEALLLALVPYEPRHEDTRLREQAALAARSHRIKPGKRGVVVSRSSTDIYMGSPSPQPLLSGHPHDARPGSSKVSRKMTLIFVGLGIAVMLAAGLSLAITLSGSNSKNETEVTPMPAPGINTTGSNNETKVTPMPAPPINTTGSNNENKVTPMPAPPINTTGSNSENKVTPMPAPPINITGSNNVTTPSMNGSMSGPVSGGESNATPPPAKRMTVSLR